MLLVGILVVAVFFDVLWSKIPNVFLGTTALFLLVYQLALGNQDQFYYLNILLVFVGLYPLYMVGVFGGGDIKLLIVMTMCVGLELVVDIFVVSLFIGAALGLVRIVVAVMGLLRGNVAFKMRELTIHYSIPIFVATLLYQYGGFSWSIF